MIIMRRFSASAYHRRPKRHSAAVRWIFRIRTTSVPKNYV